MNRAAVLAVAACLAIVPAAAQNQAQVDNTAAQIAQQNQQQAHMSSALEHLRLADRHLDRAEKNDQGHRARAQQLTQQAISQVEQGIQYANGPGARETAAAGASPAPSANVQADQMAMSGAQQYHDSQPFMAATLQELAAADRELEQAGSNKGGHRTEAMQLIAQAINETQAGIQYHANNPGGAAPSSAAANAPSGMVNITNGPVIERADQNSATIAWSTDHQGSSVIDYGTDPNNLNQTSESPWGANGLTHRVQLKNLKPGTRYYFEVETGQAKGTNGGSVESNRFAFTTPNAGQPPIQNQQPQGARF